MNVISEDKNKNINYRAWFLVTLNKINEKSSAHCPTVQSGKKKKIENVCLGGKSENEDSN